MQYEAQPWLGAHLADGDEHKRPDMAAGAAQGFSEAQIRRYAPRLAVRRRTEQYLTSDGLKRQRIWWSLDPQPSHVVQEDLFGSLS